MDIIATFLSHEDNSGNNSTASPRKANRASIEEVRNYYNEYVDIKGIRKYFRWVAWQSEDISYQKSFMLCGVLLKK